MVAVVRLYWFEKKFKDIGTHRRVFFSAELFAAVYRGAADSFLVRWSGKRGGPRDNTPPANPATSTNIRLVHLAPGPGPIDVDSEGPRHRTFRKELSVEAAAPSSSPSGQGEDTASRRSPDRTAPSHITFSDGAYNKSSQGKTLRIPGPREFDAGISSSFRRFLKHRHACRTTAVANHSDQVTELKKWMMITVRFSVTCGIRTSHF